MLLLCKYGLSSSSSLFSSLVHVASCNPLVGDDDIAVTTALSLLSKRLPYVSLFAAVLRASDYNTKRGLDLFCPILASTLSCREYTTPSGPMTMGVGDGHRSGTGVLYV